MPEKIEWDSPIDITKEQWVALLKDEEVIKARDLEIFKLIYTNEDFMATATQIANLLNMNHYAPLNSQVGRLGKRIAHKLNIEAPEEIYGDGVNWWNIPFLGARAKQGFYWILRPELKEAIDHLIISGAIKFATEINLPEEINEDNRINLYEGAKKQIYVNIYERNVLARSMCIEHYGSKCVVCGFDFEKKYGALGKNVIHVHHIKPLSEIRESYKVDPIKDLRPVCPNCHLIIHKGDPVYTIDEVIRMITLVSGSAGVGFRLGDVRNTETLDESQI